jgi:tight adherence protein B
VICSVLALLPVDWVGTLLTSAALFVLAAIVGAAAYLPGGQLIHRLERRFDRVLRHALLLDVSPRAMTIVTLVVIVLIGVAVFLLAGSLTGALIAMALAALLPGVVLKSLRRRRVAKLEDQLVPAVQSLAAGVRAGLNLVQAMELIARDNPNPIRQEFAHLLREYEYGMPLDRAMSNAADRIGSGDFRLLFSALLTHRQRGGNLGQTLDRITKSLREIQRLEKRVQTLTAQGRATARWLGVMPLIVGGILFVIESSYIYTLLTDPIGKAIILGVGLLNLVGFLWIRKIMAIDI